jgi:hypothetical protein
MSMAKVSSSHGWADNSACASSFDDDMSGQKTWVSAAKLVSAAPPLASSRSIVDKGPTADLPEIDPFEPDLDIKVSYEHRFA